MKFDLNQGVEGGGLYKRLIKGLIHAQNRIVRQ